VLGLREVAIATEAGREITMAPRTPHNLVAALGFLQIDSRAPGLQLLHQWLDNWTGVGLITVGVERLGYRLSLSHIAEGEWRGAVLRASDVGFGRLRGGSDALAGCADRGMGSGETWRCPRAPVIPTYDLMHPTQVRQPFHRPGWVYEEKIDGWRMAAYKDGKRVRLVSRSGVNHSGRFPDLVAAVASLRPQTLVLDGEIAVFDRQLRSRFDWLRDPDPEAVATPPLAMVFDMPYRAGRDLTKRPLRDRRARLEELLADTDRILPVRRLASNGLAAWAQVLDKGYEGMVAKDEASAYVAGRTRLWLKVKVPGWTDSEDRWKRIRLS
jgi:ATP dependent DNA ligase domain